MKTIIHVNQHVIKANQKHGKTDPPLTVKDYKRNRKAREVVICFPWQGRMVEVARVIYRPEKPLSCGAHVWIETDCKVGEPVKKLQRSGAPQVELDEPEPRRRHKVPTGASRSKSR